MQATLRDPWRHCYRPCGRSSQLAPPVLQTAPIGRRIPVSNSLRCTLCFLRLLLHTAFYIILVFQFLGALHLITPLPARSISLSNLGNRTFGNRDVKAS